MSKEETKVETKIDDDNEETVDEILTPSMDPDELIESFIDDPEA
jgi:hypothetical protein